MGRLADFLGVLEPCQGLNNNKCEETDLERFIQRNLWPWKQIWKINAPYKVASSLASEARIPINGNGGKPLQLAYGRQFGGSETLAVLKIKDQDESEQPDHRVLETDYKTKGRLKPSGKLHDENSYSLAFGTGSIHKDHLSTSSKVTKTISSTSSLTIHEVDEMVSMNSASLKNNNIPSEMGAASLKKAQELYWQFEEDQPTPNEPTSVPNQMHRLPFVLKHGLM
ncbi:hypothetical protein H5410_060633 [Solanum commersonii]|uniref:Uncharacterized protein n=1 Tax=Solanum commersonii TaxID=4109 RepID=A0A9J5W5K3_SOLCO|nr:hypothetical protein H5410_060633 [Solanum commersonii]